MSRDVDEEDAVAGFDGREPGARFAAALLFDLLLRLFDGFDGDTLASRWRWRYESRRNWSLTDKPGYLTIYTQAGELRDSEMDAKNILLQSLPEGDFRMETKLEFRPVSNWHQAGLIVFLDDDNFIKLDWVFDGSPKIEMGKEGGGVFSTVLTDYAPASPIVYLRLTRKGDVYSGFYSADGVKYTLTTYMLGFAIGQLFYGPLSAGDRSDRHLDRARRTCCPRH